MMQLRDATSLLAAAVMLAALWPLAGCESEHNTPQGNPAGKSRSAPANPVADAQPDPGATPVQVVRAQLAAMQHNNTPTADAGIAIAYRFASPRNKRLTGPLKHFTQMIHRPAYAPMLNSRAFQAAPARVHGDVARQAVVIKGREGRLRGYLFMLRRQGGGKFEDCWMVEGVTPIKRHGQARPGR